MSILDIGWQNNPNNKMAGANTQSTNPPATGIDPATGQPIYNPSGAPGSTAITPTQPYNPSGAPGATAITPPGPDPTKYYKPPARTDPRYIPADQHWTAQQRAAYEAAINSGPAGHEAAAQIGAASWQDYDQRRASAAAEEAADRLAWLASKTPSIQTGVDAPLYDPDTDTYSIVDKAGTWTHGLAAKDVYSHLTAPVQKQYSDWYFPEYATQQQQQRRQNIDAAAFTNEGFARMGQQTTKYAASSL